jgi:hypothetical protein
MASSSDGRTVPFCIDGKTVTVGDAVEVSLETAGMFDILMQLAGGGLLDGRDSLQPYDGNVVDVAVTTELWGN